MITNLFKNIFILLIGKDVIENKLEDLKEEKKELTFYC